MRSASTSSPSKRYHGVPSSDVDDGAEHERDALSVNAGVAAHTNLDNDTDDHDDAVESGNLHISTSPSFSRIVGRGQYNRILDSDASKSFALEQEDLDTNNDETNSLVLGDASSPSSAPMYEKTNRNGIFRESPVSTTNEGSIANPLSRTPSGAASTTSITPASIHYGEVSNHVPTGLLSRQGSRCASSTVSSVDWDDDDEFDDDIVNIRRYHLEFGQGSPQQNQQYQRGTDNQSMTSGECGMNIVSDCFSCRIRKTLSNISYHWQSLRQAARQRRAARLLTMPSESARYKVHACVMSWFCDATDIGIAFTASCILLWILFGMITRNGSIRYWMIGTALFIFRISARRCFDACRLLVFSSISYRRQQREEQRGRLGSRQHLNSVDFDHHNGGIVIDSTNQHLPLQE